MTNALSFSGRLAMSAIFLWSAVGKLQAPEAVIDYIAASGAPRPELAFLAAVAVESLGGALIAFGVAVRPAAMALAAFCLATAALFHGNLADEDQVIHALKNLAMAGGLLQLAAFGPGRWSLGQRQAQTSAAAA